jgi:uncharacterized repeat protein (TIGR03843 family)
LARKRFIHNPNANSSSKQLGSEPSGSQSEGQSSARKSASQTSSGQEDTALQITETEILQILTHGELSEQGLLPYSSNHSFLITATHNGVTLPGVYKPRRGENPLWDFEWGTLCQRETAAYVVSKTLGWNLVPPTVLREGTRGIGSVQLYISNNDREHYFTIQEDARFVPALRRLALFDFIVNNADRKSGHCLVGDDQRLWAIDHGICFHTEYKLRTVIWEFCDTPIEGDVYNDIKALQASLVEEHSPLSQVLCQLLTSAERAAMLARAKLLLQHRAFPGPQTHRRNYPWPPI